LTPMAGKIFRALGDHQEKGGTWLEGGEEASIPKPGRCRHLTKGVIYAEHDRDRRELKEGFTLGNVGGIKSPLRTAPGEQGVPTYVF